MKPINLRIVFGDPPDFHDRDFYIENKEDLRYFLKWFWKMAYEERRFGVFPTVKKVNEDD